MSDPTLEPPARLTPTPTVAFTVRPIGIVHTTHRKSARCHKYFVPRGRATLELFRPYLPGIQGLYPGVELWITTYHAPSGRLPADSWQGPEGVPGVFATNSVERPNPIEFLRARVVELHPESGLIRVEGLDVEDGAPILDIRPVTSPHHRMARPGE